MLDQPPDGGSKAHTPWGESTITVLHVDDDPAFAELCSELLEAESDRFTVAVETNAADALEYIEAHEPDCIVSDYDMPRTNGLEFLEQVRSEWSDIPFILFTGKGSEEIASEAISAGVTDYLQKSLGQEQYRILKNRIENSVTTYRSQRSLNVFRSAARHSGHSIYITDSAGVIEYVNPSFTEITGYSAEEAVGKTPAILKSGKHDAEFYSSLWGTILDGEVWENEVLNRRKNGELYVANQTIAPISARSGEPDKFVAVNQDITDRKRYQYALERQCENLEVLNKMLRYRIRDDLQTVTGYTELLEEHVDGPGEEYLDILTERSWSGAERIDAAQSFAELLYRMDSDTALIELQDVIESAIQRVEAANEHVDISVDGDVSAVPVVAGTVVEPIVQTLLRQLVRQGNAEQKITVSVSQRDGAVLTELLDKPQRVEMDPAELTEEDVRTLEATGTTASDLYLIQAIVDGYGGTVRVKHTNERIVGVDFEFPIGHRFIDEAIDTVSKSG